MSKQAPWGTQRHDNPSEQRCQRQWDDGIPGDQLHPEIGGTQRRSVPAGRSGYVKGEVGSDRAKPADRESNMHGERKPAQAEWHGHQWRPGPWSPPTPVRSRMTTSRTRMMTMIPDTFTQRGMPG